MAQDIFFIVHKPDGSKISMNLFWLSPSVAYSMHDYFPLIKDKSASFMHYTCKTTLDKILDFLGGTIEEAAARHPIFDRYFKAHEKNPSHYAQMADYIAFYKYVQEQGAITSVEVAVFGD